MVQSLCRMLTACLLCSCSEANADDAKKPTERPISLSLEIVEKTTKHGTVPKFKLTLTNEGKVTEKVIDLTDGRRPDLQDNCYDWELEREGKAVRIQRAISDPGPITDEDFLKLESGKKATFELTRFAQALDRLKPGKYKARIRFWQDPHKSWAETAYPSPYVEFTVKE